MVRTRANLAFIGPGCSWFWRFVVHIGTTKWMADRVVCVMAENTTEVDATDLDKYAGRMEWKFGDTEEVSGAEELSEGDRVAVAAGEGRQGIVEKSDGRYVTILLATGGVREYSLYKHGDEYDDGAGRFGMTGFKSDKKAQVDKLARFND